MLRMPPPPTMNPNLLTALLKNDCSGRGCLSFKKGEKKILVFAGEGISRGTRRDADPVSSHLETNRFLCQSHFMYCR